MKKLAILVLSLFAFIGTVRAQSWTGIVAPTRAINWSNAGVIGGIPNRTNICSTLAPGATAAQINSAIQACASGGVVSLAAGTYTLSSGVTFNGKSGVTLRGAGPTKTFLVFTGDTSCGGQGGDVCFIDSNPLFVGSSQVLPGGSNSHNWTAGYAQGATSLTFDSTSGLSVGQFIILDQANATKDNGSEFVCDAAGCYQSSESPSSNGRTVSGVDRNEAQIVQITAINGTTVTISPGLYMPNWSSGQSPGAWWSGNVTGDGLENLTVNNGSSSETSGIYFYDAFNCWVKNVTSLAGNRNHVWLYQSAHNTIRDSYFYGTKNAAQESYGVETFISADNLIENNIFQQVASPIMSGGGEGNVIGYNFSIDNLYNPSPSWLQTSYASHDAGDLINLFEGNHFDAIDEDDIHGTGGNVTIFRNQLDGTSSGRTANTHAIAIYFGGRGVNVVGNVLGTAGYFNAYEDSVSSSANCYTSIYNLGWPETNCVSSSSPANDPLVESMMLRWGNYDTVTGAVRWNASEVPSAIATYANPVPASEVLPTSFYLSAKPAFWGSEPFPAIGPDVSGGTGPGGYAYVEPAEQCYKSSGGSSDGTGASISVDANVCYYGGPPAPTPLAITTTSLPSATVGTAYSATIAATGGATPYTWTISGVPSGLTVTGATISGTPTISGSSTIAVTIVDSSTPQQSVIATYTLAVSVAPLPPTPGSAAFVKAAGNYGESKAYAISIAPKAGDFLVALVWQIEGAGSPTITDNLKSSYTKDCDLTYNQGAGNRRLTVYHLVSVASGLTSITVTPNRPSRTIVAEYSGLTGAMLDVCGAVNNQTSPSTSWKSTSTATSSTDLVLGLADSMQTGAAGFAAGSTWTGRLGQGDPSDVDDSFVEDQIGVSAGSYTATGTSSVSVTESALIVAYKFTSGPPPIAITISPATASVQIGDTQQFTATVTNDIANAGVTWSTNAPNGLFTASSVPGTATITATSVTDPTKSASATITITAPPVTLNCTVVSAAVGGGYAGETVSVNVSGGPSCSITIP